MAIKDDPNRAVSATGNAHKTVQKHISKQPLKFYCCWFSPFAQRAWLILEEKKIPYQYIEVDPFNKSPEFLELNPRGLVPTLGIPTKNNKNELRPLYESTIVTAYLDDAYDGVSLMPEDVYERARCRLWIDHICTKIIPSYYRFLQHTPDKDYSITEARAEFSRHVFSFAREINEAGPYFLGEQFSMVDVMLAPWAYRLFAFDLYKDGGLGLPRDGEGGKDKGTWSRWWRWVDAVTSRQSFKDTLSDRQMYVDAYIPWANDTSCAQVAQAIRRGRGMP